MSLHLHLVHRATQQGKEINTATALADALIGQAGERQLGELLHHCVATARSAVPEVPTPSPAEAEAVAEVAAAVMAAMVLFIGIFCTACHRNHLYHRGAVL